MDIVLATVAVEFPSRSRETRPQVSSSAPGEALVRGLGRGGRGGEPRGVDFPFRAGDRVEQQLRARVFDDLTAGMTMVVS